MPSQTSTHGHTFAGLGAYVTDALDPVETAELERHLADCRWCRHEVAEFSETAAELARLYAVPAPSSVRDAVLGSIGRVRPLPPLTADDLGRTDAPAPAAPDVPVLAGGTDIAAASTTSGETAADDLAARRSRRPRLPARMLIGVAAALVAVAAIGGVTVHRQLQQQADDQARVVAAQQVATARQESTILSAPDATIATRRLADGSTVTFLASRSRNAAMVISSDLLSPGPGRVYQLWTLGRANGKTTYQPDRTFGGGTDQRVVLGGDVAKATALAITVEPVGGSSSPTSAPAAVVTL